MAVRPPLDLRVRKILRGPRRRPTSMSRCGKPRVLVRPGALVTTGSASRQHEATRCSLASDAPVRAEGIGWLGVLGLPGRHACAPTGPCCATARSTDQNSADARSCANSFSALPQASRPAPPTAGYAGPSEAEPRQRPPARRHRSPPPQRAPHRQIRRRRIMSPNPLNGYKKLRLSRHKRAWPDPDSNWGHHDFQSCALPTELSGRSIDATGSPERPVVLAPCFQRPYPRANSCTSAS
jgi:hypothetical protein